DRGVDQADHAQAGLVAAFHGGLHVFGEALLEAHRWFSVCINTRSRRRLRVPASGMDHDRGAGRAGRPDQYMRWRLVTSREVRRTWRFTAAAALRLRSCVGFS